ncbi:ESPR-type extended signal peptide-containing protein, partial [Caballeronia sp. LZ043]|uniref:ESPR-type extended signal peptide-containing protein n=1 Tax=Caballeronia sp. LZ043 TaxID=3038569 RepID=UPI00285DB7AD
MNHGLFKLVYNRLRNMHVAVADFACAHGSEPAVWVAGTPSAAPHLLLRPLVAATLLCFGALASVAPTCAQIVAVPGSGAQVLQAQNGVAQVNIAKPSGAGVS